MRCHVQIQFQAIESTDVAQQEKAMEPAESKRLISNANSKANEGGGATALANRSATATSAMDALNAGASSVSDIEKLMADC